jgi:ribonuclease G
MPLVSHVGVSQRIEDEEERTRLREIIERLRSEMGAHMPGIILRTAAEDATEEALERDFNFLVKLWADIKPKLESVPPGQAILEDLPLYLRILRDMLRPQVERVRVDSRTVYDKLCEFSSQFLPGSGARIEYYSGDRPLFDLYGAEEEINRALAREVSLKSGGHVVFDQTEAMTTIDVNTGAFVGSRTLEETIFKTNLEAAQAIARQLRLRNLGGIVIIDFIDMQDESHSRQVIRTFEKALEKDHVKTKITSLSELGLLEMTRKRTRESLERILCHACPVCSGRGTLKTPETICFEIYRELIREARQYNATGYLVVASQEVVDRLLDEESANLAELAEYLGATIRFQVESLYHFEQYDVVLT